MIVRCIGKGREYLRDKSHLFHYEEYVHLDEEDLLIGKHYVVYGVAIRDGFPWYLVCDYEGDDYPRPHFSILFELTDDRVPPGWSFTLADTNVGQVAFLPTCWARDPSYLEKLVDGVPASRAFFEKLKKDLDEWHLS